MSRQPQEGIWPQRSRSRRRLSDDDPQRMLKLIKDSDSVELKPTVEPAGQTSAVVVAWDGSA